MGHILGLNGYCLPCDHYGEDRVTVCEPVLVVGVVYARVVTNPYVFFLDPDPAAFGEARDSAGVECNLDNPFLPRFGGGLISSGLGCPGLPVGSESLYHVRALAAQRAGQWASSLRIDVHCFTVFTAGAGVLFAGWYRRYDRAAFAPQCKPITIPRMTYCSRNRVGTLTYFDDDTFTLT